MEIKKLDSFDLVIIGGGIFGILTAMLAAEEGQRVLLFRLSDREKPYAETLRNQAWHQSGILFVDKGKSYPSDLSTKLKEWGRQLVQKLGIPIPQERGIIRFPEEKVEDIEAFLKNAEALRVKVRRLPEAERRAALGSFDVEGTLCWEIPDTPFPEALILHRARKRALAAGAVLRELEKPVELIPKHKMSQKDEGSMRYTPSGMEPGFYLKFAGGLYLEAKQTILAAGAGNYRLLEQLDIQHELFVRRTAMMVICDSQFLNRSILVDQKSGNPIAVVRHHPGGKTSERPKGCLVIGTRAGKEVPIEEIFERGIPQEEIDVLCAALPEDLKPEHLDHLGVPYRFTAGYEPMWGGKDWIRKEDNFLKTFNQFPGLVLGMPGRATLGLLAATQVLEKMGVLKESGGSPDQIEAPRIPIPQGQRDAPDWLPGQDWKDPIWMHYEPFYDDKLNERE